MKNRKVALACISLAALSGCSSEIDVIREGRLELLPEYKVGQALDNRKLCESTYWSVIEDERGRDVVRYTCYFCLLYTSPSPRDLSTSRMPSSA